MEADSFCSDVACGVHVSVDGLTAVLTLVGAVTEVELLGYALATCATDLGGGEEAVYCLYFGAVPRCLVFNLAAEGSEADVEDCLVEACLLADVLSGFFDGSSSGCGHACHTEVFRCR